MLITWFKATFDHFPKQFKRLSRVEEHDPMHKSGADEVATQQVTALNSACEVPN